MQNNEFWLLFWVILLGFFCVLVLGGSAIYTSHVEQVVPGRAETIWVKP